MPEDEPKLQSVTAKKAETSRQSLGLATFHLSGDLRLRANKVLADLVDLEQKGIGFSPFLEIGAGRGPRSAALINRYSAQGVATDISPALQDAPYVAAALHYNDLPLLICCDAHHIPFLANSFQFVFAYRTLHHFANPIPVLAECYRLLAKDGYLFFNEEPLDSAFRRFLRGKRVLTSQPSKMQELGYRFGVEKVFWDDGEYERGLGMVEARYDIDLWRKALQPFSILDVEVNRKLKIRSDLYKPALNSFLSGIIGGNIKGLCKKEEGESVNGDFRERLICLDCSSTQLIKVKDESILCENCKREYPMVRGVVRMLPLQLEAELYAENLSLTRTRENQFAR